MVLSVRLKKTYDFLDTSIHIPADSFFALEEGLFSNNYETESFKASGFYAYDDFYNFGLRIEMLENRVKDLLDKYRNKNDRTLNLVQRSFLSRPAKELFTSHYLDRLKMLNHSFSKKI